MFFDQTSKTESILSGITSHLVRGHLEKSFANNDAVIAIAENANFNFSRALERLDPVQQLDQKRWIVER